uniref:Ig-like domain-containing protein n=1 Tax=Chelonoidis abingdonii TaxID=106734 RepID=A0A8C0J4N7_CHEAB
MRPHSPKATARCGVAGVFPTVGEARFTLSFGGESLNFTVTTSGDTATAEGEVWSPFPGQRELNCTVTMGPMSRSARQSVLIYSFPQPVLEIDQPQALVNRNVSVTCSALRTLASGPQPRLQLTLTTHKGDNGRQFTCEGNLTLGSRSLIKNMSAQLIVLYQPTLDESGCPSHQTWLEGTLQQLACEADGNPMPEVSCSKDSQVYGTSGVQNITRGHAGIYLCSAANAHGMAGRNVTIHVESSNTEVYSMTGTESKTELVGTENRTPRLGPFWGAVSQTPMSALSQLQTNHPLQPLLSAQLLSRARRSPDLFVLPHL